jgi:hypothetical protein
VKRPVALEITGGDFAFAAGHRRIATSLVAGTLNSTAAFSIVACSACCPSTSRRRVRASLIKLHADHLDNGHPVGNILSD